MISGIVRNPGDGPPLEALALDQAEDHAEEAERGDRDAEDVKTMTPTRAQVRDHQQGSGENEDPDGDVDVEDPAPAEVGDDEAAEGRPGHDRESRDDAEHREDPTALVGREDREHDRQALGGQDRGAHALR